MSRHEVEARVDDTLAMLGIGDLADRAPYQLSGGEKKRVALASVLAMNPEVYNAELWQARLVNAWAKAGADLKKEKRTARLYDMVIRWNRRTDAGR